MIINKAVATSAKEQLFGFTQGCDVDQRLHAQEIAVQRAWLRALERSRFLTTDEAHALDRP